MEDKYAMLNQGSELIEEKDYLNSFFLLYSHFFFHTRKNRNIENTWRKRKIQVKHRMENNFFSNWKPHQQITREKT